MHAFYKPCTSRRFRPTHTAATAAALAASTERVSLIEHRGARYVAKRLADRPRSLLQALSRLLMG